VLSRDAYDARKLLTPAVSVGKGAASGAGIQVLAWDSPDLWRPLVAEADAVFHLAGTPLAEEKWTPEYKEKIQQSRVRTTRALAGAAPRVLINASAVGYYGDRNDDPLPESEPPGNDFLSEVCVAWEAEAERVTEQGGRVCRMRLGAILGPDGGMLRGLLDPPNVPFSPWKVGLGGPLGSGRQWVPWIHIEDVIALMLYCAFEQPEAQGAINTVSPNPVRNAELAHAIGHQLHRPSFVHAPGFALRAMVGEFADALLVSQRALPAAAQKLGYEFRFPELEPALEDLLK